MNFLATIFPIKTSTWKLGSLVVVSLIAGSSFLVRDPMTDNEKIDAIYQKQIDFAVIKLIAFEKAVSSKSSSRVLRKGFKDARIAYKQAAVLIDYFHPAETKLLNGAALSRTEEDNPINIILPHGFQVIEELVYDRLDDSAYTTLAKEITAVRNILLQLERQPDRAYKFKNPIVLNALQAAMIRMISLGITGFDSPIANNSVEEAAATLEAIRNLVAVYRSDTETQTLFAVAIRYLKKHTAFNSFDRLEFISQYAQPIYGVLSRLTLEPGFELPHGKRPINEKSAAIFSEAFFDVSFFSPAGRFEATPERIAAGKKLFFDPILSSTKDRSCASCHKPELAFTDGLKTAMGIDKYTSLQRNTPTLWNSVYQTRQFYDSRVGLLEHQLNAVVHNQQEMGGSLDQSARDLAASAEYQALFNKAYAGEEEKISQYTIANAISGYVRSLTSMNSRLDQYMNGDKIRLSAEERKGFNLFMGKAKCGTCHFAPLFNGLVPPDFSDTESEVIGVPGNLDKGKSRLDADEGKYSYSRSPLHKFAFKTPSLRNIALTAPYMHNGIFKTLEEVIDFYNEGGGTGLKIAPPNQTLPPDKLNLSTSEKKALLAFMQALTDSAVINYKY